MVLAGGEGSRLRPVIKDIPKGMVEVCGKPLLQWIIEWLEDNQVTNIVLGVAYLKESIMDYFGDGLKFGVNISYSVHAVEGGTGQGFRLAISRYIDEEDFFALNGDQITDLNLRDLASYHLEHEALATVAVNHPRCLFGHVGLDEEGCITGFREKPLCPYSHVNMGIYAFNRGILQYLPERGDVEKTTFPRLAEMGLLRGYLFTGFFTTINTAKDLVNAEAELRRRCL